jgi:hypothetical protein
MAAASIFNVRLPDVLVKMTYLTKIVERTLLDNVSFNQHLATVPEATILQLEPCLSNTVVFLQTCSLHGNAKALLCLRIT